MSKHSLGGVGLPAQGCTWEGPGGSELLAWPPGEVTVGRVVTSWLQAQNGWKMWPFGDFQMLWDGFQCPWCPLMPCRVFPVPTR